MSFVILLAMTMQTSDEAKNAIADLQKHYAALESFSSTIVHHDDTGLFPGDYTQELKWRKGGRFELKVTKATNYTPGSGAPGMKAPNYFANGSDVMAVGPDKRRTTSTLSIDPNSSPGWEVSGGPIMGWLQGTPMSKAILNPPNDIKAEYEFGKATTWQGEKVKEVLLTWKGGGQTMPISFFLALDGKALIGYAFTSQGRTGWCIYRNQKQNPKLADNLGEHPR